MFAAAGAAAGGAQPLAAGAAGTLNPVWLAQSKLRRRRFDECIDICSAVLHANPYDQVRGRRSRGAGFALVRSRGGARARAARLMPGQSQGSPGAAERARVSTRLLGARCGRRPGTSNAAR